MHPATSNIAAIQIEYIEASFLDQFTKSASIRTKTRKQQERQT
jgi:hypothetical protein